MSVNSLDQRVVPSAWVEADEGNYFVATNPTPGNGIAQSVVTSFTATSPIAAMFNNNTAASTIRVYLDYIRLINTAAGATSTSGQLAVKLDLISSFWTGGGTAITPVNVNADSTAISQLVIHFGALTAVENLPRLISRLTLKTQATPCWVVGDEILIRFGNPAPSGCGLLSGAAASAFAFDAPPVVIAPQCSAGVYLWNPANSATAPSWEFEIGYWER